MPTKLSEEDIAKRLTEIPEWSRDGDAIVRKYSAGSFREAQALVNRICDVAEGAAHHPDLSWTYVHLTIGFSTHDAGGLTSADFRLAALVDHVLAD